MSSQTITGIVDFIDVNVTGIMEWWNVGMMGDQIDLMFNLTQYSIIPIFHHSLYKYHDSDCKKYKRFYVRDRLEQVINSGFLPVAL